MPNGGYDPNDEKMKEYRRGLKEETLAKFSQHLIDNDWARFDITKEYDEVYAQNLGPKAIVKARATFEGRGQHPGYLFMNMNTLAELIGWDALEGTLVVDMTARRELLDSGYYASVYGIPVHVAEDMPDDRIAVLGSDEEICLIKTGCYGCRQESEPDIEDDYEPIDEDGNYRIA